MNKNRIFLAIGIGLLILVVCAGVMGTLFIGKKIETDERNNLLLRVQTLAVSIDPENITHLTGTLEDLENPFYQKTKNIMEQVHSVNKDTRFVYLMGLNGDTQFFYVDSEDPSSPDYSHPGQVYSDADELDILNHKKGIAYTKGPYTDSWGSWFSATAPILSKDGTVLAMVGMDIKSEDVLLRIAIVKKATMIIAGLVFLSLLLLVLFAENSLQQNKNTLQ